MTTILYPTRGGQSSYPNQDSVIAMAKEMNADLIFLHIANVRFLENIGHISHLDIIEDELDHLSEFLLAMAKERAEKGGVQADAIVRQGAFRPAIKEIITERNVDIVILGAPVSKDAATSIDYVMDFMKTLITELNVEVYVLQIGKVLEHRKPESPA